MTQLTYDFHLPTETNQSLTYQVLQAQSTSIHDLGDTLAHLRRTLPKQELEELNLGTYLLASILASHHADHLTSQTEVHVKLVVSVIPK